MSFVLEYGLWLLPPVVLSWMWVSRRRLVESLRAHTPAWFAVATVSAQVAYYTFDIGGDHFEFRVYSHLVPLLAWLTVWLASRWNRPAIALGFPALVLAVSLPIPWSHHLASRDLRYKESAHVDVAPHLPQALSPITRRFDQHQLWLRKHGVCIRQHVHRLYYEHQVSFWPGRDETIPGDGRPVLVRGGVGVPGWVLPEVIIIDRLGLNDRVVARNPTRSKKRHMAHDRRPPEGYTKCFRPNVVRVNDEWIAVARKKPLTDEQIRDCESRDWTSTTPDPDPT